MTSSRGILEELDTTGLDTVLSEAACLGATVDTRAKLLHLEVEAQTLPEPGGILPTADPLTGHTRIRLTFEGVTRVAASLRSQRWNDLGPRVLPLELSGLGEAITSFGGGRLHGWEFIDIDDSGWALWSELLSFDTVIDDRRNARHVLEFSQEEGVDPRELDVRVWFDTVEAHLTDGRTVPLSELVSAARRWWAAHDAGDPRALHPGITPAL
ncbi:hypothetical protein [Nocardia paucivorans]|uniref:hypothetical protein n=1 Tax=Nocardia paucivorans TaxID=114259 RepID=UPI0002EDC0D1|nr:hypothetical protein [Nocardia paucivorans]